MYRTRREIAVLSIAAGVVTGVVAVGVFAPQPTHCSVAHASAARLKTLMRIL